MERLIERYNGLDYSRECEKHRYYICEICGRETKCEEEITACSNHRRKYICGDCIVDNLTVDNLTEFASEETVSVEINKFLANMFTESEIEEILKKELKEAERLGMLKKERLRKYINGNEEEYADYLYKKEGR